MKRTWIKPRRRSKAETVDGDSPKNVKDECERLVQKIIALRDRSCVTCKRVVELHVGHLFRRGIEPLRWNLINCHGQCDPCNSRHEYEPAHYEAAFRFRFGSIAYDILEIMSRSTHKFSYIQLLAIRDGLRSELAFRIGEQFWREPAPMRFV